MGWKLAAASVLLLSLTSCVSHEERIDRLVAEHDARCIAMYGTTPGTMDHARCRFMLADMHGNRGSSARPPLAAPVQSTPIRPPRNDDMVGTWPNTTRCTTSRDFTGDLVTTCNQ